MRECRILKLAINGVYSYKNFGAQWLSLIALLRNYRGFLLTTYSIESI